MLYTIEAGRERQNCKLTELELGYLCWFDENEVYDWWILTFLEDYEDLLYEWIIFSSTKRIYCSGFNW